MENFEILSVNFKKNAVGAHVPGNAVGFVDITFQNGLKISGIHVHRSTKNKLSFTFPTYTDIRGRAYPVVTFPEDIHDDLLEEITTYIHAEIA